MYHNESSMVMKECSNERVVFLDDVLGHRPMTLLLLCRPSSLKHSQTLPKCIYEAMRSARKPEEWPDKCGW
jgi:hypothetical protein